MGGSPGVIRTSTGQRSHPPRGEENKDKCAASAPVRTLSFIHGDPTRREQVINKGHDPGRSRREKKPRWSAAPGLMSPPCEPAGRSATHVYFWGGSAHRPGGDAGVTAAAPPLLRMLPGLKEQASRPGRRQGRRHCGAMRSKASHAATARGRPFTVLFFL